MKDEKLHKVDQATMIIGITFMSSLLIALTIALWRLCKRARFKFLFTLIILLMLSDAAFAILSVCFYYEHTDVHENYTKALAWTVGGWRANACRRGCQPPRSALPPTAPCAATNRRLSHIADRYQ